MKWVPKLSGCPLTLAMKLDLIPSTWHIQKSQTSFYLKSCFSLIHLLTLPTVLSSPNTTLIMSHPCLKPFLPQAASIQRGNSNISMNEQSPAILSYQGGFLQPSSSPFPWSGPSPLTPSPPRCSLGTLGSDDYSLTQVTLSTQECPLHFSAQETYTYGVWQSSTLPRDPSTLLLVSCSPSPSQLPQCHCLSESVWDAVGQAQQLRPHL